LHDHRTQLDGSRGHYARDQDPVQRSCPGWKRTLIQNPARFGQLLRRVRANVDNSGASNACAKSEGGAAQLSDFALQVESVGPHELSAAPDPPGIV
jgi:hypothetical protein